MKRALFMPIETVLTAVRAVDSCQLRPAARIPLAETGPSREATGRSKKTVSNSLPLSGVIKPRDADRDTSEATPRCTSIFLDTRAGVANFFETRGPDSGQNSSHKEPGISARSLEPRSPFLALQSRDAKSGHLP